MLAFSSLSLLFFSLCLYFSTGSFFISPFLFRFPTFPQPLSSLSFFASLKILLLPLHNFSPSFPHLLYLSILFPLLFRYLSVFSLFSFLIRSLQLLFLEFSTAISSCLFVPFSTFLLFTFSTLPFHFNIML
jgi:hypothetical protein